MFEGDLYIHIFDILLTHFYDTLILTQVLGLSNTDVERLFDAEWSVQKIVKKLVNEFHRIDGNKKTQRGLVEVCTATIHQSVITAAKMK